MPHHRLFDKERKPHWYTRIDLSSGRLTYWFPLWIRDSDTYIQVPHPIEIGPIGARWMT